MRILDNNTMTLKGQLIGVFKTANSLPLSQKLKEL